MADTNKTFVTRRLLVPAARSRDSLPSSIRLGVSAASRSLNRVRVRVLDSILRSPQSLMRRSYRGASADVLWLSNATVVALDIVGLAGFLALAVLSVVLETVRNVIQRGSLLEPLGTAGIVKNRPNTNPATTHITTPTLLPSPSTKPSTTPLLLTPPLQHLYIPFHTTTSANLPDAPTRPPSYLAPSAVLPLIVPLTGLSGVPLTCS